MATSNVISVVRSYSGHRTSFLQEYLLFPRSSYDADGLLTDEAVAFAIKILLEQGVFDSLSEIQNEAYKKYGIFLTVPVK